MGYAIFHATKGRGSGFSLGSHIDREEGQEHTFKNADETRKNLNIHFKTAYTGMKLNEAIEKRIAVGRKSKTKIRKDAVKYVPMVLTGTHEDMKRIFADEKTKTDWINANINFVKAEFGAENILRFTLHMDEKTPHIHAVIIPLTEDGRLSCKEVLGDRSIMSERQTKYAEAMQQFGLKRGIVGSKKIHNSEGYFQGKILERFEHDIKEFINPSTTNIVLNPKLFQRALKSSVEQNVQHELKVESQESKINTLQEQLTRSKSEHQEATSQKLEEISKNHKLNSKLLISYKLLNGIKVDEKDKNLISSDVERVKNHFEKNKPAEKVNHQKKQGPDL